MAWKMKSTKSWVAKLRPDLEPKIVHSGRTGERMLVATPLMVAEEIRKVRKGRLTTPKRIRERLADRTGAESACAMTTGIFLSILAGAAEEQLTEGKRPVAPYWRVVEEDGSLRAKNPAGPAIQAKRLRAEGHRVRKQPGRETWKVQGVRGT